MILNSTECPKRRIDFTILSQNSGSMTGSCSFKCPNLKISLKKKMWNQRNKKWKKLRRCLQKKTLRTWTKSRERIKRIKILNNISKQQIKTTRKLTIKTRSQISWFQAPWTQVQSTPLSNSVSFVSLTIINTPNFWQWMMTNLTIWTYYQPPQFKKTKISLF